MLGWELAPHATGGLGVACSKLARSLSEQGAEVLFVLPRARGDEDAGGAKVRSCPAPRGAGSVHGERWGPHSLDAGVRTREFDSALRPYMSADEYRRQHFDRRASGGGHAELTGGYGPTLFEEVQRFAQGVEEAAEGESFDVIHAHDWMTFAAGRRVSERLGRPLICHVHSTERDRRPFDPDPRIEHEEQRAFEVADRIVCVSEFAAEALCERYDIERARVRTVHNAGDHGGSLSLSSEARPPKRSPRVLFLGRLTDQKGPLTFLEACAKVFSREPEAEAYVCGEGELSGACLRRAEELGIADRVTFTGFVSSAAVHEMYAAADVFVLPSVSEPFGLTPLEALAAGTPALVSRQSGVAEVLSSSVQFDHWNVDDLAQKILAVLRFPTLARELVAAGRAELRRLGWDASALTLLRVYEEVAS